MARKAIAVEKRHVHIERTQRDALMHDVRAFVDHRRHVAGVDCRR
jgi:hypothetical protein